MKHMNKVICLWKPTKFLYTVYNIFLFKMLPQTLAIGHWELTMLQCLALLFHEEQYSTSSL